MMQAIKAIATALMLALASTAQAGDYGYGSGTASGTGADTGSAAPGGDFRKVSELVALPAFIEGMGTLYVQPETMPAGPFLAYDRDGNHVSTIYMIPLDEMKAHAKWRDLGARGRAVKRVDVNYNPGHPGVNEPHYHIKLWHVAPARAELG